MDSHTIALANNMFDLECGPLRHRNVKLPVARPNKDSRTWPQSATTRSVNIKIYSQDHENNYRLKLENHPNQ